jgi:hypothetical protein
MTGTKPIADALAAVQALTSEQILSRLAELGQEEQQLRVLLRAARAREREEGQAGSGGPARGA